MRTSARNIFRLGSGTPGLGTQSLGTPAKILLLVVVAASIALLQACGSANPNYPPVTTLNPAPGMSLQSIQITPSTSLISIAENRQLLATGIYNNGGTVDITSQVTWSSSSPSSPTNNVVVSSAGVATGVALGGGVVTATVGPVVGLIQLTVDSNGFSSNTIGILSVPYKTTEVDAAYLPASQSTIQGTYAVQEVNLDADQFSSQIPVPVALLASIPMPPGFVPNATVASPASALVAVISYSSPSVQIIDASNNPADPFNNTVVNTFRAPVSQTVAFNGTTCMICAAVVDPVTNKLLLSTSQGYYSMDLTAGKFTALPFASALPAPSFTLNPIAADPYILSSTFGQNPPAPGEVQILDLTTNAVTTNTTWGLTAPYGSAVDLSGNFAVVGDVGADDQTLLNLADLQNPTFTQVPGMGACAAGSMSMTALGVGANVNPANVTPTLFLSQPSGNCVGFELWGANPLDLSVSQYGYGPMPSKPDGTPFTNGSDPNTITTFNSVVDKKNYAVLVDASQNWIAKINPQPIIAATTFGTLPLGSSVASFLGTVAPYNSVVYLPTPASTVTLSQTDVTFANQTVGTPSVPAAITLANINANIGANPVFISQIAIQGANPGDFVELDSCAGVVPADSKCVINITFIPTATGPRSAVLSITDNGGASPQTVILSGTGT